MLQKIDSSFFDIYRFKSPTKIASGFSLVELMIVMLIMLIVSGAAFTLFRTATRYEAAQQDILEHTQNLRTSIYTIARDVRMAGNGLGLIGSRVVDIYVPKNLSDPLTQDGEGWFKYKGAKQTGVRAIYGTNSGSNKPGEADTITLFRTKVEATNPIGTLAATFTPGGSSSLVLNEPVVVNEVVKNGDILAIASEDKVVLIEALFSASGGSSTKNITVGPRFKPEKNLPKSANDSGAYSFQVGSSVYNLRDIIFVTYYVDSINNKLMANYHDNSLKAVDSKLASTNFLVIADNIEDLQVGYFLSSSTGAVSQMVPDINEDELASKRVQAVKLVLVSRSSRKTDLAGKGEPIVAMGHTGSDKEGYSRRVMSETVYVRNN